MKIKILFPQIVIDSKEFEMPNEKYEEITNSNISDQIKFIWDNMTERDRECTQGAKWMEDFAEVGLCCIKTV